MAEVTIVYWRDIPAQVIVGKGRRDGGGIDLAHDVGLGLLDGDNVRERDEAATPVLLGVGLVRQHDGHLDAQNALAHHHVAHGGDDVVVAHLAGAV